MADFLVHRLIRVCRHRLKGSIEGWPLVLCLLLLTPVPANVGEPNRTCSGPSNIRTYLHDYNAGNEEEDNIFLQSLTCEGAWGG